jgi:hypothetical protein
VEHGESTRGGESEMVISGFSQGDDMNCEVTAELLAASAERILRQ